MGKGSDVVEQQKNQNKVAELEAIEASILEAIPYAVVGLRDRHVIFANDGVQTVFGWRIDELLGRRSRVFYRTDEDDDRIAHELYTTLETQKTLATEFPCRRRDGRDITCRVTVSRIGETLKEKNVVITYEDITELKQVEEAYETMANSSQAGVYVVQDGLFVFVNRNAADFAGYRVEELIGTTPLSLVHPDDRETVLRNSQRMLRGVQFSPHEYRIMTKSGDLRWIMETVALISYRGRKAILGNSMDITALIHARDKLVEMEALEASILGAIPHAVIGLQNRRINFANDGVKSVFGWTSDELIGKSIRLLYRTDLDYERIAGLIYAILEKQPIVSMEFPCRRKDGGDIECMISAARIGRQLEEKRIVITYENITDRKRGERELEQSREELRNLSAHLQSVREKERTRIARELHDELGQLLTALNTEIILLKNKIPPELPNLSNKAQSMENLVEMTMQTVKKIYMDLRPGMLDHLGLTAAMGWQAEEFSKRTGIACKVSFKPEDITLDPDLTTTLFRIFQETLTNIRRHAEAKKVSVRLKVTTDRVEFVVKDNGKGITEEQMQKPDSFGLLGVRERVYHWGGRVDIVGQSGKGTTITVRIPRKKTGDET